MFSKDELNRLYRYSISLCQQQDLAYDLVQAAIERYLKKCQQINGVNHIDKPIAYLKTIIRNMYFDQLRHNNVIQMLPLDHEDNQDEPPVEDELESVLINQQQVEALIETLSAEENELLYLWAVEEHSMSEIAKILGSPRGTILSKIHRLKNRLRQEFACEETATGDTNG